MVLSGAHLAMAHYVYPAHMGPVDNEAHHMVTHSARDVDVVVYNRVHQPRKVSRTIEIGTAGWELVCPEIITPEKEKDDAAINNQRGW